MKKQNDVNAAKGKGSHKVSGKARITRRIKQERQQNHTEELNQEQERWE